ncbi:hypothetical protein V8F06_001033, partial [Rhypophila decipiens]
MLRRVRARPPRGLVLLLSLVHCASPLGSTQERRRNNAKRCDVRCAQGKTWAQGRLGRLVATPSGGGEEEGSKDDELSPSQEL